ncbi:hypothetical protein D3X11_05140 [Streptococcus sp. X16XC17]|uniref:hypothetical protein n=1 Tax=unclassified Streptococcus TaxID=2608887 RepID=UPI00066FFBA1|nr:MULTISPECIES: hypothetical protein [unclassified Streptococcus]TCD45615.1 hypothetical protein D3X11_05140 [Streptococcus sp. X16XC17]
MKPTYVISPKNAGLDLFAGVMTAKALYENFGHPYEVASVTEADAQTQFAFERFGFELPQVIETLADKTDNATYIGSLNPEDYTNDMDQIQMFAAFSNQTISGLIAPAVHVNVHPYKTTSAVIFDLYHNFRHFEVSSQLAGLLLAAYIVETNNFEGELGFEDQSFVTYLKSKIDFDLDKFAKKLLSK